ncbi:hypothetical protein [Paenibacillus sp. PL2-23]|uniref:DUF6960 family protein n=1 Tax=Paenibacillus sp. PL2-23 TaxID=2100729 RepID=UPI0030FCF95C
MKDIWGIYPWFKEDGQELIEPRYREKFSSLRPYGKVFLCVGEQDQYIVLQYNKQSFLVKPTLFQKILTPKFTFGQAVRIRSNPEVFGFICEINWHHKTEREMYYIEVNGKKKSSRYFSKDLIDMEGA